MLGIFAIMQILIMITSTVSESYVISQSNSLYENKVISNKNDFGNLLDFSLDFLIGFLTIKQIASVSAQQLTCCEKANNAWCVEKSDPG